ncbi:FRG domain-containing protein [Enterococcus casseliflavus]|uniref:FRG domain-containing protein n=2 Tax=Enterococcus casseliflavus TaxID=37734 RepID=UPI0023309079|nr:FRG domain-containing protein [Enterococcus casseliflavus]MDB1696148.1 FRG domain-containing protein [Enterococcus casseliflavus]MDB1699756.1 FRG domain-containing protein [Enterococcus casseliflavus]MDB1702306.1 FRG domain-containing protein [Enterococcus casseliflavus]MDB1704598.1 FRG domain-containing protein [Enterococcus casseliflavus]
MCKEENKTEINSLQDFISKFDEKEFSGNFYYRGEPKDYSCTILNDNISPVDTRNMASGYRWMLQNGKTFKDLLWLRNDYYREIGHTLTEKETENFIAYAQHHGLPTELLDITSNSAVALYFACERDDEEDGYIYLFDNNGYDSDGRNTNKFYDSLYHDLTKNLISRNPKKQYLLFRWTKEIYDDHIQKELMEKHNDFIYLLFRESDEWLLLSEAYSEYQKLKENNDLSLMLVDEDLRKFFDSKDLQEAIQVFRDMFSNLSVENLIHAKKTFCINASLSLVGKGEQRFFPELKLLLHEPSIVFDRMRNQAGEFVYQLNDHGSNQKAIPSHTFVIPASRKRKILSQLNTIGINQKFIYPDHDNIAQYYAKNYSKSFQKKMHPLSFKSGNSHK